MWRSIDPTVTEPHPRAATRAREAERWRCRRAHPRADTGETARHRCYLLQVHDHRRDGRLRSRSARMVTAGIVHRYCISKLSAGCERVIDFDFGAVALDTPRELTREVIDA